MTRLRLWFPHIVERFKEPGCELCSTCPSKRCSPRLGMESSRGDIVIHGADLSRMFTQLRDTTPDSWLSDKLIDAYFRLLEMRSERCDRKHLRTCRSDARAWPKVKVFSSFFYSQLRVGRSSSSSSQATDCIDYARVRRWTRLIDVRA